MGRSDPRTGASDPRTGLSDRKDTESTGRKDLKTGGRKELKTAGLGRKTLDTSGRKTSGREHTSMDGMNMDLKKHAEEYVFVADLPGFETEEISLSFADDTLLVTAESEFSDEMVSDTDETAIRDTDETAIRDTDETAIRDTDETAIRGTFSRSRSVSERVVIPETIVEEDISATYRNSVLEVHLPLVQSASVDDETKIDIAD